MTPFDVEPDNLSLAPMPETSAIHGGVQNSSWLPARIKLEQSLQQFGIFTVPD
jgi:hypothetical protein